MSFTRPPEYRAGAPAFSLDNGATINPAYAAYYADPTRFFGNAAPTYNNLRARPFYNEDFSILKKTRVTEATYFEIRAEFFNLFNRGRFGVPGVNLNDLNLSNAANPFGNFAVSERGSTIDQPRRVQIAARFVF